MDHATTLGMKKVASWSDPKILKIRKNILNDYYKQFLNPAFNA